MSPPQTILGTLVGYASSNVFRQLLSTLLIQPKLLSPELFGLWNLLKVIPAYAAHAHLGAKDSARYLIPFNHARQADAKNADIQGTLCIGSLVLTLLIVLGVLPFMFLPEISVAARVGIPAAIMVTLLTWRFQYRLTLLKAAQAFYLITKVNYIKSFTAFVTSITLIVMFGIYGLYSSAILTLLISILILEKGHRYGKNGTFSLTLYRHLVKIGFPILLFYLSSILLITSGRILISWKLGNEQLGYYSLSSLILGGLLQIPGAAREIIEPRLMEQTGRQARIAYNTFLIKPLINTAFYMTFLISGVIVVFPLFCELLLPRYTAGIMPVRVIAFGAYFMAMMYVFRGVIVAQRRQTGAAMIMSVTVVFNVIAGIAVLEAGGGIIGMAAVTALSGFVLFAALLVFVWSGIQHMTPRKKRVLYQLAIPFPIMALLLAAGWRLSSWLFLDRIPACLFELTFCWSGLFLMCRGFARHIPLLDDFSIKQITRSLKR
jgi:O-antigen/teichoic acid export membrane protein